ncbi:MAG: fructosamine kinase family protein [Longimicrobiales bacterium]|nr:fructosamine kinase family protein [Longimicrobiales bacterium]
MTALRAGHPPPLPAAVREGVASDLSRALGRAVTVLGGRPVSGGCINRALTLETTAGPFFLKWNRGAAGAAFPGEAVGLEALRRGAEPAGLLRVPRVFGARAAAPEGAGWLVLEHLPPSRPAPGYQRALGEGLAALHGAGGGTRFGWEADNHLGALPQPNVWRDGWADFWREARLGVQLRAARAEGVLRPEDEAWGEALMESVDAALAPVAPEPPGLVHGDLWSGNVHPGPDGRPVLVDPAVYLGHGEVDLAMAELFGGFPAGAFAAYRAVRSTPPGYEEVRRPLYQLHYLLVHLRLFGDAYRTAVRSTAQAVLSALRR